MPFFSQRCDRKKNKKIKNVTLQVRILRTRKQICRKRVFLAISRSGSMTVEAALVLPLFLFACLMMMMPFSIMDRERQVQAVLERTAKDISQMAPLEDGSQVWTAYAQVQIRTKLESLKLRGLSLSGSQILEDGETVHLVAEYGMPLPFSVFRIGDVRRVSQSCRRAWIGKEGGRTGEGNPEDDDDPMVYIGKNSTRYHVSRTCHYLANQLTGVPLVNIEEHRNSSGSRYKPCSRCAGGGGTMVYIMPSGERYHSSASCTAIAAYIKAVKKSTVAHLGACSYCGGGSG